MKFAKSLILAVPAFMVLPAYALDVTLAPGELASRMPLIQGTAEVRLVLKGSATAADMALLRDLPDNITILDMSDLSLEWNVVPANLVSGTAVAELKLPRNAESLADNALAVTNLREVEIPASVTQVGDYALAGNHKLVKVVVKGSPAFGAGVFYDSPLLSEVEMTTPLRKVSRAMFKGCRSLTAIPVGVTEIGDEAFRGSGLLQADLSSVTAAGSYAFADCPDLCQVMFGTGDIQLGTGVFYGDMGLAELPQWEGNVPPLMGASSAAYTTRTINSPEIGEAAFANNRRFSSLALGPAVRAVKADAFRNADSLKKINAVQLGENVPDVDVTSFAGLESSDGTYDITLTVGLNAKEAWQQHPVWRLFRLQGETTGLAEFPDASGISITRNGAVVTVATNDPIDIAEVYDLRGIKLFEGGNGFDRLDIDIPAADIVVVSVRTADGAVKIAKLR